MQSADVHIPVLKREAVAALNIKSDGVYLDATLGRTGHAQAIANALGNQGRLYCMDRDPVAVDYGNKVFASDSRVKILQGEFARMSELLLNFAEVKKVDGILMDLGVSSPQLDQSERGFSFMRDGALDMRMDPSKGESAADWLARVEEAELVKVLFEFGEEKFARRIAKAVTISREESRIETTLQLAGIIEQSIPYKEKHKHPATRTFQAIRLQVNQELKQISDALPQAVDLLNEGGRLAIISFHSLEDRIVKRFMRSMATPNLPPKNIPVSEDAYQTPLKLVGKAIKPSSEELEVNRRARSSVLRVAERTGTPLASGDQYA